MANSPQARKRARQAESRRQRNASQRSALRTAIKKVISAVNTGDAATAKTAFEAAVLVIDPSFTAEDVRIAVEGSPLFLRAPLQLPTY